MKILSISIRSRLLNYARSSGQSFNNVLDQYGTGRFLARLSQSPHHERFVLKGAQLFRLWNANLHRPTRDIDFLGFGDPSEDSLAKLLNEVCQRKPFPDDGLLWDKVKTTPIRDEMRYGGTRVQVLATLAGARIPLQIDIGFGDAITPAPVTSEWAGLLDFPASRILVYPPETVIAEKLEAAVILGFANSRMKDFYDLLWLSNHQNFDFGILQSAARATFNRRGTVFPETPPPVLTREFGMDPRKVTQWNAFIAKANLDAPKFPETISRILDFLIPLFERKKEDLKLKWVPQGGWSS